MIELLWILVSIATSVAIIVVTAVNPSSSKKSLPYLIASMPLLTLTIYALTQLIMIVDSGVCRPSLGFHIFTLGSCDSYIFLLSLLIGIDVPATTYFLGLSIKYSKVEA